MVALLFPVDDDKAGSLLAKEARRNQQETEKHDYKKQVFSVPIYMKRRKYLLYQSVLYRY